MTANLDPASWTYGAEHEWADWDTTKPLPPGYGRDRKDITIVNSTGVANDPKDVLHQRGGEINTPPTTSIQGQLDCLAELRAHYPEATVNYRSNLHLHIRVPGLRDDLDALKRVQAHIHEWMPKALPIIEPLNMAVVGAFHSDADPEVFKGYKRRLRRMRVSHHTLLKPERVAWQLQAETPEDFFRREAPVSRTTGQPLFPMQPRVCVNLRQLRETDTIEFRHWPGTLDEDELVTAFVWCQQYMECALRDQPIDHMLDWALSGETATFPRFKPYDHWLEERYRRTVHDGTIPREQLAINIAEVLQERRPT